MRSLIQDGKKCAHGQELGHFPARYKPRAKANLALRVMQQLCRREAFEDNPPLQPGDRAEAIADIARSRGGLGCTPKIKIPKIKIKEGLPRFVAWFSDYHGP